MASDERLRELEDKYEGYTVNDSSGSKIGKVDDLFVDETDREEYIGVKMGFFGRKSTLIPMEVVRVDEGNRTIEVPETKDHVKDAPSFNDDDEITTDYEQRIRSHFGLDSGQGSSAGGSYGAYAGSSPGPLAGSGESQTSQDYSSGSSQDSPSGTEAGYEQQQAGSSSEGSETTRVAPEYGGNEETGATAGAADRFAGIGGAESGSSSASESETREVPTSSSAPASGSSPTTSRQTEETETFQEGGRTKVRRRIIREEVVDADEDQGPR